MNCHFQGKRRFAKVLSLISQFFFFKKKESADLNKLNMHIVDR
jgi:hypothetical protein